MSANITLLEQKTQTIHFRGNGEVLRKKQGFEVRFKDRTYSYCWKIYEKACTIQSSSEIDVFLTLKENHRTKGHIDSEYGRIPVECELIEYTVCKDEVEVMYDLIQGSARQRFHFILSIKEDM